MTYMPQALSSCPGTAFSGESLAARFGVSRAAVWKAVGALREAGYPISGTGGKLCSSAAQYFANEQEKRKYDAYLEYIDKILSHELPVTASFVTHFHRSVIVFRFV